MDTSALDWVPYGETLCELSNCVDQLGSVFWSIASTLLDKSFECHPTTVRMELTLWLPVSCIFNCGFGLLIDRQPCHSSVHKVTALCRAGLVCILVVIMEDESTRGRAAPRSPLKSAPLVA
jgi:hypothetical protein